MVLLETKALSFKYPGEQKQALHNVSLHIEKGEFVVICGPSGSGKSTLLRLFKREIAPHGKQEGAIFFKGTSLEKGDPIDLAKNIGIVFQDPENQIVMDRVQEELAFGLENIGLSTERMRTKLAEMAHYFGIHPLMNEKIHHLSGGQKQIINLASILLMEPELLLLDEPTAQLDPVSSKDFFHMVKQMNEEFGVTILMAEHHLEEALPLADRVIVFNQGKVVFDGPPKEMMKKIWEEQIQEMFPYLPSPSLLYLEYETEAETENIPLTVKEGKRWVQQLHVHERPLPKEKVLLKGRPILELNNIQFQYERTAPKIVDHLSLSVYPGEWLAIVGANGTGKSTLLKILAGIVQPQKGKRLYKGKPFREPVVGEVAYLPQNPKLMFLYDTVFEELKAHLPAGEKDDRLHELIQFFELEPLLYRHPYDVSGGELQKVALASLLLTAPSLLLLDEPTKGLDPVMKQQLGRYLKEMQKNGLTLIMVTHDIEFAAQFASRCAMMFQGDLTITGETREFFKGNTFYTTAINRVTRDAKLPECVTLEEAKEKWVR